MRFRVEEREKPVRLEMNVDSILKYFRLRKRDTYDHLSLNFDGMEAFAPARLTSYKMPWGSEDTLAHHYHCAIGETDAVTRNGRSHKGKPYLVRVSFVPSELSSSSVFGMFPEGSQEIFPEQGLLAKKTKGTYDIWINEKVLLAIGSDGKYVSSGPQSVRAEANWYDKNTAEWRTAA